MAEYKPQSPAPAEAGENVSEEITTVHRRRIDQPTTANKRIMAEEVKTFDSVVAEVKEKAKEVGGEPAAESESTASPKVPTVEEVTETASPPPAEMTSEEALLSVAERKARISQALTRGLINDALADIDHPPDIRCVWIRETDEDIARRKMMGYVIEMRYGEKFVDHDRSDNIRRFGDCILMSCTMENFEMIEEVRREQITLLKDAGRREFLTKAAGVSEVGVFDESEDLSPGSP